MPRHNPDPGFSIGTGEIVNFDFMVPCGDVFNQVVVAVPTKSLIEGSLLSNGTVYINNPAGVTFVDGAVINVEGIIAAAAEVIDLATWNTLRAGGAAAFTFSTACFMRALIRTSIHPPLILSLSKDRASAQPWFDGAHHERKKLTMAERPVATRSS